MVKNGTDATLLIYDVISDGWGISAKDVVEAIAQVSDADVLNIRINSPGGDVFEARAIIEAIKRFKGKTIAHIDSLAASAATGIACAANEVLISEGGYYMIHNASGVACGDKNAMLEMAALLEKIEFSLITDYTNKTNKTSQQITDWMNAETWFSAKEAIDNGFVDGLSPTSTKAKNTWNLDSFTKTPDELKNTAQPLDNTQPDPQQPAAAGFLMSSANANRMRLLTVL
jgi:ATP-dependent protease ClpP protease subunit